jgi:hypothetical protein
MSVNHRNSERKAGAPEASPWATEPVPVATPLDARTFFVEGQLRRVALAIIRPRDRARTAVLRESSSPTACTCCGRTYAPDGAFGLAQSLANRSAFATTWICARCAEMDDEALLDVAEKSFSDALGGAYMRRAS